MKIKTGQKYLDTGLEKTYTVVEQDGKDLTIVEDRTGYRDVALLDCGIVYFCGLTSYYPTKFTVEE